MKLSFVIWVACSLSQYSKRRALYYVQLQTISGYYYDRINCMIWCRLQWQYVNSLVYLLYGLFGLRCRSLYWYSNGYCLSTAMMVLWVCILSSGPVFVINSTSNDCFLYPNRILLLFYEIFRSLTLFCPSLVVWLFFLR
jgi:hypothetical protein